MTRTESTPIENSHIEEAIEQHEDLDQRNRTTAEEVKARISRIQQENQKHLVGMLDAAYSTDGDLDIIKETETEYYFLDEEGAELDDMINYIDESGTVVGSIIRRSFNEKVQAETDTELADDGFVVEKPARWGDAEWADRRELTYLLENGLSPAEVLDYWFVEQQNCSPTEWAKSRGIPKQDVRENVHTAENKITDRDMLQSFIS